MIIVKGKQYFSKRFVQGYGLFFLISGILVGIFMGTVI